MSTAEQLLHEPPTPWMPDDDPPCKHCGRTFAPGYSYEECPVRLRAEVDRLRADRERLYARNVGAAIAALDAAGYGKPGTPNTLRDMVQEAVAEVERLHHTNAWRCSDCGCSFLGKHMKPELLEGVTRCSRCVEVEQYGLLVAKLRAEGEALYGRLITEVDQLTLDKCALVVNLTESTLDNGRLSAFRGKAEPVLEWMSEFAAHQKGVEARAALAELETPETGPSPPDCPGCGSPPPHDWGFVIDRDGTSWTLCTSCGHLWDPEI